MNTNTTTSGLYQPLSKHQQEIRLLEVADSPTGTGSALELLLTTVSLQAKPEFIALSYVWGDPTITREVSVNGCTMAVTTNLASILQLLATMGGGSRIWADAICINQANTAERNHQVSLMETIYSSATLVFGWIGEANDQIARGMIRIAQIAQSVGKLRENELHSLKWLAKQSAFNVVDPSDATSQDTGVAEDQWHDEDQWRDVESFLSVPYWRRIWIFQELVLGKAVCISCRTHIMPLDTILLACSKINEIASLQATMGTRIERLGGETASEKFSLQDNWLRMMLNCRMFLEMGPQFEILLRARRLRKGFSELESWTVRHALRGLRATDPKDHIYGLLGVTGLNITPDYSTHTTVAAVYQEFTAAWLDRLQSQVGDEAEASPIPPLTFLESAGVGILENTCRLPTWAPNYPDLPDAAGRSPIRTKPCAADRGVFGREAKKSFISGATLSVTGTRISPIATPGPFLSVEGKGDLARISEHNEILSYLSKQVGNTAVYPNGQMTLLAFVQVIPGIHGRRAADGEDRLSFLAFLCRALRGRCNVGEILRVLDLESKDKLLSFVGGDNLCTNILTQLIDVGLSTVESLKFVASMMRDAISTVSDLVATLKNDWRFFNTEAGWIGLGPKWLEAGDVVCILNGLSRPAILRRVEDHYIFIGDCFIAGLMDGEAAELVKAGTVVIEGINIK